MWGSDEGRADLADDIAAETPSNLACSGGADDGGLVSDTDSEWPFSWDSSSASDVTSGDGEGGVALPMGFLEGHDRAMPGLDTPGVYAMHTHSGVDVPPPPSDPTIDTGTWHSDATVLPQQQAARAAAGARSERRQMRRHEVKNSRELTRGSSVEALYAPLSAPVVKTDVAEEAVASKRARSSSNTFYTLRASLPDELAFKLLTDEHERCSGARPEFLNAQGQATYLGRIYKEKVNVTKEGKLHAKTKRPTRSDFWRKSARGTTNKLGRFYLDGGTGRPCLCGDADATVASVGDVLLCRQYITVQTREMSSSNKKLPKDRWAQADEWSLLWKFDQGQAHDSFPCNYRVFHVKCRGRFDEADADTYTRGIPSHVRGMLTLELDGKSKSRTFLNFLDEQGRSRGNISDTGHGARLQTPAGDLAEWHVRDPAESPFERGDIVGFGPSGLTRQTQGCKQLGIITAQAAVAGSTPTDPKKAASGDYVAFTGVVAVKVRGPVRRHDFIVPSGLQDGSGKAASSHYAPSAYVGRASVDLASVDGSSCTRRVLFSRIENAPQLVVCNVVAPPHTVSSDWIRSSYYKVTVMLVMLMLVMLMLVWAPGASVASRKDGLLDAESDQVANNPRESDQVANNPRSGRVDLRCPTHTVQIEPDGRPFRRLLLPRLNSGHGKRDRLSDMVLKFTSVPAGSTQSAACPGPSFSGVVIQHCLPNGSWGAREGNCTRNPCKPRVYTVAAYEDPYNSTHHEITQTMVTVPDANFGDLIQVPACSNFSGTGSCIDDPDAKYHCGDPQLGAFDYQSICKKGSAGVVSLACGTETGTGSWAPSFNARVPGIPNGGGHSVVFARHYDTKLAIPEHHAAHLYDRFVDTVGVVLAGSSRTTWRLPKDGVLSAVSIGLGTERRDIVATGHGPMDRVDSTSSTSVDASPDRLDRASKWMHYRAKGRASAAFARAACSELGFESSPFVTTCSGLQQLLSISNTSRTDTFSHEAASAAILNDLCAEMQENPSGKCPTWLEVREPSLDSKLHLAWLRSNALSNGQGAVFRLQPTDEEDLPDWAMMDASDWVVGPVPPSPSCAGSEASVMQCFQHQVIIPVEKRQAWTRPCGQKLIVACTKSPQSYGTWVTGDSNTEQRSGAPDAIRLPKIFADTNGPLACATGKPATPTEIATATSGTLCWGTVIGEDDMLLPLKA